MQIQVKQSYKGKNIYSLYRFPFVYSKRPNIGPADYWSLTLATIDVSSLYTNIPQDEGTEACLDALEAQEASHIPRNTLRQLFDIVPRCNVFSFDGQVYQQIQGTAMGTRMAPSYANLFMDRFERAFLAQEPILPLIWKRYIDDILCIWPGTRSELDSFLDTLNKAHRTLRFTWSISDERIEFLDLNIFKGGRFTTTRSKHTLQKH